MKYIREIIVILLVILLTILLGSWNYVEDLDMWFILAINKYIYIFFIISCIYMMGRFILNSNKTNKIGLIIVYSIVIFLMLFVRKKYDTFKYSFDFYLIDWIKRMFKSKAIFVGLMGNLILFIPLGFILSKINDKKLWNILIGTGIIVVLEICQFVSKRGIFDIVDILLNISGLLLGVLIVKKGDINLWQKIKMKNKQKMMKKQN